MRLHLSFVAARQRKSGQIDFLERTGDLAAGATPASVSAKYQQFISPGEASDKLRRKYSHVLFVIDNVERAQHEFPDPEEVERARKQQRLVQLRQTLGDSVARARVALETAASASLAMDHSEELAAEVTALEKELGITTPAVTPAPVPPQQPPRQPAVPAVAELEDFTDEQLLNVSAQHDVPLTPSITREQLISAIRAKVGPRPNTNAVDITLADTAPARQTRPVVDAEGFSRLDTMTDEQLAKLAIALGISVTPSTTRRTLLEAIRVTTVRQPITGKPLTPAPSALMGETPLLVAPIPTKKNEEREVGLESADKIPPSPSPVTAKEGAAEALSSLTVVDLKAHCEALGIDTTGFKVKADYIAAIELDDELSELTIPQLKEKATALEIDITGLRRKRQLLDVIEAHERKASKP